MFLVCDKKRIYLYVLLIQLCINMGTLIFNHIPVYT